MSEHSPEPWHLEHDSKDNPNARRIIACVNACKGIPTEALESGEAVVSQKVCSHACLETICMASGEAHTFVRALDGIESHDCEVCRKLAEE